jgi:hypothetical protein
MKKYQIFVLSMILIATSQLSFAGQEQQRAIPAIPVLYATRASGNPEKPFAITFKDNRCKRPITKNYETVQDFTGADPDYDPFKRAYDHTKPHQNNYKSTTKK